MPDAQGRANFAVIGHNKDGTLAKPYAFSSDELSKAYEKDLYSKVKLQPRMSMDDDITQRSLRNKQPAGERWYPFSK